MLVDLEVAHQGITELHVVDTMHTRKALMGEKSDAFYDQLLGFLDHAVAQGMLKQQSREILLVANSVNDAFIKLNI